MNTPAFLNEQVALFQGFTAERLQQSVDGSRVVSFEAREAIVHRGEAATRQILAQLKAGDSFNEMALMTGDAMLADIIAESRCEVLLIPISLFQSCHRGRAGRSATSFADHHGTHEGGLA